MSDSPRTTLLCAALLLALAGCQSGWDDRVPTDDDDSTFPTDDDDSTADDDDSTADDDDSTADDDDSTADDDDSGDDDDATSDDDDSGDDDDATGDDDDDATSDDDDATPNPNDGDSDGYEGPFGDGSDCDDLNPAVNPGASEDPSNGVDDDCDGFVDELATITSVVPTDGIAVGGTLITITGDGFNATTSLTLDGASITPQINSDSEITIIAPGGVVGDVDLVVVSPFANLTETDAYTYTGDASTLDSGVLNGPLTSTAGLNVAQGPFTATVTESGVTGTGSAPVGLIAQIGYGTQGQIPTTWPDFFWSEATWDSASGGADVFGAQITPHTYGTWVVSFRFSDDGGYNWLYVDSNSSTSLQAIEFAQVSVTP